MTGISRLGDGQHNSVGSVRYLQTLFWVIKYLHCIPAPKESQYSFHSLRVVVKLMGWQKWRKVKCWKYLILVLLLNLFKRQASPRSGVEGQVLPGSANQTVHLWETPTPTPLYSTNSYSILPGLATGLLPHITAALCGRYYFYPHFVALRRFRDTK